MKTHETRLPVVVSTLTGINFPSSSTACVISKAARIETIAIQTASTANQRPGQTLTHKNTLVLSETAERELQIGTYRRPYPNAKSLRSTLSSPRNRSGLNSSGSA